MAFTLGDAIVKILGDDAPLTKTLGSAEGRVKTFVGNAASGIKKALGGALLLGTTAVVGGVLAIGTSALRTEVQFRDSTNNIQAALGATEERADQLGQVMRDVWGNNFGDSVADVEQGIVAVEMALKRVGGVSDEQLGKSTEDAFRLRDAYGIGVEESISAVVTLMHDMELSADQAFDVLSKGMQDGLNSNGDFLDSIGEYSNVFKETGFSADEMYSILQSGAQGAVLGTDKVADAIKEMNIRLNEGGKDVSAAFNQIGMNFGEVQNAVRSGQGTWADYFPDIISGLQQIEDPIARNAAQVAIFGTMAEDLGTTFTDSLSSMTTSLDDMAGATDKLDEQYKDWPTMFEGVKRKVELALKPISDNLLDLANAAMPQVQEKIEQFGGYLEEKLPIAINFFKDLYDRVQSIVTGFSGFSLFSGFEVSPEIRESFMLLVERIQGVIQTLVAFAIENIPIIVEKFQEIAVIFGEWATNLIGSIDIEAIILSILEAIHGLFDFISENGELITNILLGVGAAIAAFAIITTVVGWITSLMAAWAAMTGAIATGGGIFATIVAILGGPVTLVIAAVAALIGLLAVAWTNNWFGIQEKTAVAIEFIQTAISTFLTNVQTWWAQNGEAIMAFVNTFNETIMGYYQAMVDVVTTIFAGFMEGVNGDWSAFGQSLVDATLIAINALVDVIKSLWSLVSPVLQNFFASTKTSFNNVDWAGLGKSIINGVIQGIKAQANQLYSTLRGIADGALQAAKNALFARSPARKAVPIGESIPDGMIVGIKARKEQLQQAMRNLVQLPNGLASQAAGALGGGGTTNNNRNTTIEGDRVVINTNANAADVANAVDRRRRAKLELRYGY